MDYLDLEAERLKLDPQETKVYSECDICGSEIYVGQEYYNFEGNILCEQCFDEFQEYKKKECSRIAGEEYGD